jgi:hypothetical protein
MVQDRGGRRQPDLLRRTPRECQLSRLDPVVQAQFQLHDLSDNTVWTVSVADGAYLAMARGGFGAIPSQLCQIEIGGLGGG